ncbi:MAG: hypothetical protein UR94_C0048G0003 [Parcubacteria group bacterium GW2011_GWA2_36_10]|nr:MAG: hypothetical protein UR94_C0048G0003 [Parcubacteria group bacterium GW2011_GWA2_36_10]
MLPVTRNADDINRLFQQLSGLSLSQRPLVVFLSDGVNFSNPGICLYPGRDYVGLVVSGQEKIVYFSEIVLLDFHYIIREEGLPGRIESEAAFVRYSQHIIGFVCRGETTMVKQVIGVNYNNGIVMFLDERGEALSSSMSQIAEIIICSK